MGTQHGTVSSNRTATLANDGQQPSQIDKVKNPNFAHQSAHQSTMILKYKRTNGYDINHALLDANRAFDLLNVVNEFVCNQLKCYQQL